MGIAKLYGQKASGTNINGIIKDYHAYAGENISAGDLVEYINGIAGTTTKTSSDKSIIAKDSYGLYMSAYKLSNNKVLILHGTSSSSDTSNYLHGIVCTISGVTISLGTDTQISTDQASGANFNAAVLSENKVFIAHRSSVYTACLYGIICTVNGTTITVGNDTAINTTTYTGHWGITATKLSDTVVFVTHTYNSSNYYLSGNVCTISGTSITKGSHYTLLSTAGTSMAVASSKCAEGKVFIAHNYGNSSSTNYLYAVVANISGTTITVGIDTAINTSITYTGRRLSTTICGNGNIFIAHGAYSTDRHLYGVVCSVSGTTITAGTDTVLGATLYAGGTTLQIGGESPAITLSDGNIFIAHRRNSTNYNLYGMVCVISGRGITAKTATQLSTVSYSGYCLGTVLTENGNVFIAHTGNSTFHINGQVFGINATTYTPTNQIVEDKYETQVRKTTTSKFDGVAKTSGVGGTTTAPKDYVSIYTL